MSNTFDWIEIRTNDIEKTAHFYESLFGWKITEHVTVDGYEVRIFDTGGEPRLQNLRRGGMWLRPPSESPGIVVYVEVDDIETTLQRVVELGGKINTPKIPIGASYGAFFTDPTGVLIGLYEEKVGK